MQPIADLKPACRARTWTCRYVLILLGLACASPCRAAQQDAAQWIVVTPPAFRETIRPLIDYRRANGFKVVIVMTTNVLTAEQIRNGDGMPLQAYLNRLCSSNQAPNYVLLAGAVTASDPAIAEKTVVPTVRGSVGRMKGKLSDYGYSLPEKDGKPTVAIGRFPARTVAEVRAMVQKTLEFEQDRQPGAWHNRLTMLA